MGRTEYLNDPEAPKRSSLVPAAGAREETGVTVEITGLPCIYSDPGHLVCYRSDGETRQEY